MKPEKEISFLINTIEDLKGSKLSEGFYQYLTTLINDGHEISFYRKGNEEKDTTIKTLEHLNNFRNHFRYPPVE